MFSFSITTIASCLAFALLLLLRTLLDLKSVIFSLRRFHSYLHQKTNCFQTCRIPEYDDLTSFPNPLYRKALAYVTSLPSTEDAHAVDVGKKSNDFLVQPALNQSVVDQFNGARVYWTHVSGCLQLRVRHVDRPRVLRPYLQYIESVYVKSDDAKLFVRSGDSWKGTPFAHPATFENLSVDVDLVNRVKADLDLFSKGRSYYNGVGRAWRRSYLLHGPPGTGKTAFAAAMANHLGYDVYEVDLSTSSLDLKSLLLKTGPKSLILVEGVRRGLDENLAQVVNFLEGVCNSGEGRITVFTMSDRGKEEVDSGLLKMDVHVKFMHCDFKGFKRMAMKYLGVKEHKLYGEVEERFGKTGGGKVSYREVGEIMVANRGSPSRAIKLVANLLNRVSVSNGEGGDGGGKEEGEDGCGGGGGGLGFGKEATVREIKKLYGMIRRSGSRREGTMSVEMAAAAAAAAAASAKGSGSDRSTGSLR